MTFTFITKADLQTRQWSVLMNYTVLHWLFMQKQIVLRRLHIKPTQRRPKRPKKSTYVFKCTWINGMTFSFSFFLVQIYCYKKKKKKKKTWKKNLKIKLENHLSVKLSCVIARKYMFKLKSQILEKKRMLSKLVENNYVLFLKNVRHIFIKYMLIMSAL